jgi:hypothetical protein
MINSALTRWLKQGLARGMCPLCRVAHKADREFLWHFFEEYSTSESGVEALRAARGFCGAHADALRRLEVDGLGSTLGISEIYEEVFFGIVDQLARLDIGSEGAAAAAPCPACANREREVAANAEHLASLLREDARSRERFRQSGGLCLPHFAVAWAVPESDRSLLLEVERTAAQAVLSELAEHIRKQGAEARDEPPGAERESWRRAIELTAGWPPPPDLIGVPEARDHELTRTAR